MVLFFLLFQVIHFLASTTCQKGYFGSTCDILSKCNGINGTDPKVCSGHGTCSIVSKTGDLDNDHYFICVCDKNYSPLIGEDCDYDYKTICQGQYPDSNLEGKVLRVLGEDCYFIDIYPQTTTWIDGQRYCEKNGANLVSIHSEEENEIVFILASEAVDRNPRINAAWIGFTDEKDENDWEWTDQTVVEFTKWAKGEPDSNDPWENYALMFVRKDGEEWKDLPSKFWDDFGPGPYGNDWQPTPVCKLGTVYVYEYDGFFDVERGIEAGVVFINVLVWGCIICVLLCCCSCCVSNVIFISSSSCLYFRNKKSRTKSYVLEARRNNLELDVSVRGSINEEVDEKEYGKYQEIEEEKKVFE